jgi:hypothetical protein
MLSNDRYLQPPEPTKEDCIEYAITDLKHTCEDLANGSSAAEEAGLTFISEAIWELHQQAEELQVMLEAKLAEWNGADTQYDTLDERNDLT